MSDAKAVNAPLSTDSSPRKKSTRIPSLCLHKPTGLGYVDLNGKVFYLGPYGEVETQRAYNRKVAEWIAAGRQLPVEPTEITVAEMIDRFWTHAETYYRNAKGELSTEVDNIRLSFRPVLALYGDTPASQFGPLALRTVRDQMIRDALLVRININKRIGRIKMVFKWAASMEIIPGSTYQALQTVPGLRRGRTEAREGNKVRPAPMELVEAVQPFISRHVWAIIQLQLMTGARPGELLIMRPKDIDRSKAVWIYKPDDHKTANWGYDRFIYIGPRAQEVLTPFLLRPAEEFCFSAWEAERERYKKMREEKIAAGCYHRGNHENRKPKTARKVARSYDVDAYRKAIDRALEKAFPLPSHLARKFREPVPVYEARLGKALLAQVEQWRRDHHWHPHQLRHNAATEIRKEFGIEAAKIILGHQSVGITEIYAEQAGRRRWTRS